MAVCNVFVGNRHYGIAHNMDTQKIITPEFIRHVVVVAILRMAWWMLFVWPPKRN